MEIEMLDAPEVREEPAAIQQTSIALVQSALVEFDAVAAGLADLKARFGNVIYDVGTTSGMAAAKAARLEIRAPRYAVDKVLKATKEPLNAIKEYGLTFGEAIHRLAAVESWTQTEGATA